MIHTGLPGGKGPEHIGFEVVQLEVMVACFSQDTLYIKLHRVPGMNLVYGPSQPATDSRDDTEYARPYSPQG